MTAAAETVPGKEAQRAAETVPNAEARKVPAGAARSAGLRKAVTETVLSAESRRAAAEMDMTSAAKHQAEAAATGTEATRLPVGQNKNERRKKIFVIYKQMGYNIFRYCNLFL